MLWYFLHNNVSIYININIRVYCIDINIHVSSRYNNGV